MPDDSYVLKYLQFLGKFLSVGPPVLFVLNNTGKIIVAFYYTRDATELYNPLPLE